MAGLDPAIHASGGLEIGVDGRIAARSREPVRP
jgi:hypothetical protein